MFISYIYLRSTRELFIICHWNFILTHTLTNSPHFILFYCYFFSVLILKHVISACISWPEEITWTLLNSTGQSVYFTCRKEHWIFMYNTFLGLYKTRNKIFNRGKLILFRVKNVKKQKIRIILNYFCNINIFISAKQKFLIIKYPHIKYLIRFL